MARFLETPGQQAFMYATLAAVCGYMAWTAIENAIVLQDFGVRVNPTFEQGVTVGAFGSLAAFATATSLSMLQLVGRTTKRTA